MSSDSLLTDSSASLETTSARTDELLARHAHVLTKLFNWFGVDFHLVDGSSGELIRGGSGAESSADWDRRGALCRAVAHRGQAEFIEEEEPLLVLAIPLVSSLEESVVAVGTFVTSYFVSEHQLRSVARLLGLDEQEATRWIGRQACWTAEVLLRTARLAGEQLASEQKIKSLQQEVHDVSAHLSNTYEEIGLLYRLTQNLKLSRTDIELAELALGWLAEAVPAEGLAIQLLPPQSAPEGTEPTLVTRGRCPIDSAEVTAFVEQLHPSARPLVVNPPRTARSDWAFPEIRQLIVVPLMETGHRYGWLLAFNHAAGGEFGTVEASLLGSVGAILGIHCGNTDLFRQQKELFSGVVRALTSAVDAKDPYTCGHSDRVARVAVRLAEELGCDRKQLDTIYLSGLLHDIGKIGIDDDVLRKPGKLTPAEYDHIKTHAEIGHKILCDIKQLEDVLPVVLHHHEQWNGKGYPRGLSGADIPYLARIVAVADSFDAMGSDRPYRPGMSDEKLDAILREGAGSQWDAEVVAAFFRARDAIREIAHQETNVLQLDLPEWS